MTAVGQGATTFNDKGHNAIRQIFVLDHLRFAISTPSAALMAQVAALWSESFFFHGSDSPVDGDSTPVPLRFYATGSLLPPNALAPAVYAAGDLTVRRTEAGFLLTCGQSWLALDGGALQAWGVLTADFAQTRPQDQRDFFLLLILMAGHRRGYYGLHANALANQRRAYLLIGPSGSGKSTLTLRLLQQGWRCGGDDLVLLQPTSASNGRGTIFALRRDFAFAPDTLACLPDLAAGALSQATLPGASAKQIVPAALIAPTAQQRVFQPALLLFTAIHDQVESTLTPMASPAALVTLAQQSAGILTDRVIAQRQLRALAQLVATTTSYQLVLGRDVFTNPARVAAQLQALSDHETDAYG